MVAKPFSLDEHPDYFLLLHSLTLNKIITFRQLVDRIITAGTFMEVIRAFDLILPVVMTSRNGLPSALREKLAGLLLALIRHSSQQLATKPESRAVKRKTRYKGFPA